MRFTYQADQRVPGKGGKLFWCSACGYECHADFNASVKVPHRFFREWHWQPRVQQRLNALSGERSGGRRLGRAPPTIQREARSQTSEHVNVVGLLVVQRGEDSDAIPSRTQPSAFTCWSGGASLAGGMAMGRQKQLLSSTVNSFGQRLTPR